MRRFMGLIAFLVIVMPAVAQALAEPQTPPAGADRSGQTPSSSASGAAVEPQGFTYNAEGRRDPFVSLLQRGSDAERSAAAIRTPGLAGLGVAEVTLRGTFASRSGYVAILHGADSKNYIVRPGQKLMDGTIRTITETTMVILQQVNDPLSLEKEREVRKTLRQNEEAK